MADEIPREDLVYPHHIIGAVNAGHHAKARGLVSKALKQQKAMGKDTTREQIIGYVAKRVRPRQSPEDLTAALDAPPKAPKRSKEQIASDREKLRGQATDEWQTVDPSIPRSDIKALESAGHIETQVRESWQKTDSVRSNQLFGGQGVVRKQRNLEFRRAAGLEEEPPQ